MLLKHNRWVIERQIESYIDRSITFSNSFHILNLKNSYSLNEFSSFSFLQYWSLLALVSVLNSLFNHNFSLQFYKTLKSHLILLHLYFVHTSNFFFPFYSIWLFIYSSNYLLMPHLLPQRFLCHFIHQKGWLAIVPRISQLFPTYLQ